MGELAGICRDVAARRDAFYRADKLHGGNNRGRQLKSPRSERETVADIRIANGARSFFSGGPFRLYARQPRRVEAPDAVIRRYSPRKEEGPDSGQVYRSSARIGDGDSIVYKIAELLFDDGTLA